MTKYYLMHKDVVCGTIIFDETTGHVVSYKDNKNGFSPYLGNSDVQKIKKWWEMRAIPASRSMVEDILKNAGCINTETYLAKNLGLSITDTYWVCPADIKLTYDKIKFQNFETYNNGKIPYHNESSYDFNASLGGQMDKYWNLEGNIPELIKESSKYFGQQSVNEVVATKIHEMQNNNIPFVKYIAKNKEGHGILSYCKAFTSENVELISAYEVLGSTKSKNDISPYDTYINICVDNGLEREIIQNYMDYQTMTDFIISNTDEHLNNFGVLRDANTMKLIGVAPIYDSGNSMFYKDEVCIPYSRSKLLSTQISSFYKTEDKMLSKVKNRNIVKLDLLPSAREIKEMYIGYGIPEEKAEFICKNYETKVEMTKNFQQGKTISLYTEQEKDKNKKNADIINKTNKTKGTNKTDKSDISKTKDGKNTLKSKKLSFNGWLKENRLDKEYKELAFVKKDDNPFLKLYKAYLEDKNVEINEMNRPRLNESIKE